MSVLPRTLAVARPGRLIPSAGDRLRRLLWRRPEWWCLLLCVAAWLVLLEHAVAGSGMSMAGGSHGAMAMAMPEPSTAGGFSPWLAAAADWLVMVVAMMLPLELRAIRNTVQRSLWRRRDRAIGGFLAGYLVLWLLAGLGLQLMLSAGAAAIGRLLPGLAGVAFGLAALWELTPLKRRALRGCHRTTPLAPRGRRADRDCVTYGWMMGTYCLGSCWLLMLACVLAEHGFLAMLLAAPIGMLGRYTLQPARRAIVILYVKQATLTLLLGLAVIYTLTSVVG